MNSLDYQNLLVEHRYNVAKLINSDEISSLQRLKLLRYAESLKQKINDLSTRITIQFEIDENIEPHHIERSDQEPDCLTVGDFKSAQPKGA